MTRITDDEYTADGTRLFNASKPHGTVYANGPLPAKWVQDGVLYGADRRPIGAVPALTTPALGAPAVETVEVPYVPAVRITKGRKVSQSEVGA